jgi:hypothetical protein
MLLAHLQDQEAHAPTATTPAARRSIELEWQYTTDPPSTVSSSSNFSFPRRSRGASLGLRTQR